MLFATLGMLVMVSANDLMSLYLGLELHAGALRPRRLQPRQRPVGRGRAEVFRAGRARPRACCSMAPRWSTASPAPRFHRAGATPSGSRRRVRRADRRPRLRASPAWPSRSRRCLSTCGRRTSMRARQPRSRPSSPPPRRSPPWRCCARAARAVRRPGRAVAAGHHADLSVASMALGAFAAIGQTTSSA